MKNHFVKLLLGLLVLLSFNTYGVFVNTHHEASVRSGTLPVRDIFLFIKSSYATKGKYGQHTYWKKYKSDENRKNEKNGILYTCKGGYLDLAHVRNAIDWVGFLASRLYPIILNEINHYTHKGEETTLYQLNFYYPHEFSQLPIEEKSKVAKELSIKVAQRVAYNSLVWHEIITWSGYIKEFYYERPSAFSFEDNYSNILGIIIGGLAIQSEENFNDAADFYLKKYLNELLPIEKEEAISLMDGLAHKWWNPDVLIPVNKKIIKRHLDYGQFDHIIRPWIVPTSFCKYKEKSYDLSIPQIEEVGSIDFSHLYEILIKANLGHQDKKIRYYFPDSPEIINTLDPDIHFKDIVEIIRKDLRILMNDPNADQM